MEIEVSFKVTSVPEQIAWHLTEKIVLLELLPGERIAESALAKELGVSRVPIREAFRILEKKMLLELTPRHGAKVTEMPPHFVESLYDILLELYMITVRRAVVNSDDGDRRRLAEATRRVEDSASSAEPLAYYHAIFEWESALGQAAHDVLLDRVIGDLSPSVRRTQFATLSRRGDEFRQNAKFLKDAAEYIAQRNEEMAARTLRAYVQNEKDFAMKLPMEAMHESPPAKKKP
jgi:DNA-binding GntR family transcriptional regulator